MQLSVADPKGSPRSNICHFHAVKFQENVENNRLARLPLPLEPCLGNPGSATDYPDECG